jgi:hypothetical protein
MEVTAEPVPKTYRSPVQDIGLPILGLLFLACSPGPLLGGPGRGGTVGEVLGVFLAIVLAVFGLAMIVFPISNRLLVAADGLTCRYNLRTRRIPWSDVLSVGAMPAQSLGSWWWLQIQTPARQVPVKSVMGTRKYVERVAAEINGLIAGQVAAPSVGAA